ncbi:MAG: hypothetical protein JO257_33835 [Deltaproteobacteria bacterium]|nr:hypothetical protein [Deltaproteobacteria bacterium]
MNCPACGVPVVPGYTRCPKCHNALPQRSTNTVEGGTSLEPTDGPRVPPAVFIGIGLVGVALIVWLGLRHRGADSTPTANAAPAPQQVTQTAQTPTLAPAAPVPSTAPRGPTPDSVANNVQTALRRQRLWSSVTVRGSTVEVRSGACADPAMKPALENAAPQFKAAGLTTLRCVEQSGAVVFARDL